MSAVMLQMLRGGIDIRRHHLKGIYTCIIGKGKKQRASIPSGEVICTLHMEDPNDTDELVEPWGDEYGPIMLGHQGFKATLRPWDPYSCILAAAIRNHLVHLPIRPGGCVFALECSLRTLSHVVDIIGWQGKLVGVISPSHPAAPSREQLKLFSKRYPQTKVFLEDVQSANVESYERLLSLPLASKYSFLMGLHAVLGAESPLRLLADSDDDTKVKICKHIFSFIETEAIDYKSLIVGKGPPDTRPEAIRDVVLTHIDILESWRERRDYTLKKDGKECISNNDSKDDEKGSGDDRDSRKQLPSKWAFLDLPTHNVNQMVSNIKRLSSGQRTGLREKEQLSLNPYFRNRAVLFVMYFAHRDQRLRKGGKRKGKTDGSCSSMDEGTVMKRSGAEETQALTDTMTDMEKPGRPFGYSAPTAPPDMAPPAPPAMPDDGPSDIPIPAFSLKSALQNVGPPGAAPPAAPGLPGPPGLTGPPAQPAPRTSASKAHAATKVPASERESLAQNLGAPGAAPGLPGPPGLSSAHPGQSPPAQGAPRSATSAPKAPPSKATPAAVEKAAREAEAAAERRREERAAAEMRAAASQASLPQRAARSDGLVASRNQQPPITPPPQTNLSIMGLSGASGRRPTAPERPSFANELDLASLQALQAAELNHSTLASLGDPFNIPEVRPLHWDGLGGGPMEVPLRGAAAASKTKSQKDARAHPHQDRDPRSLQHPGYGTTPSYASAAALEAQVWPLSDVQQQVRLAAAAAVGLNDMEAVMSDFGGFRPPPGLPPGIWDGLGPLPMGAFGGPQEAAFAAGLTSQARHASGVTVDPYQGGYGRGGSGLGPPGGLERLGGKGGGVDPALLRSAFGDLLPSDVRGPRGARNGLDADDDGLAWPSSLPKR